MPLSSFSPATRAWFESAFVAPTPVQARAWPAIARGEHVLLSAPTGSGKTLAAFLWAIDRLSVAGESPDAIAARDRRSGGGRLGGRRGTVAGDAAGAGRDTGDGSSATARAGVWDPPRGAASGHVRVVYVSPLKALAYDIERNLRAPLRGIGAENVRVGIRTGDTPQRERAAMARNPPDILVTTPESLYLILASRARVMLSGVEAVIVDEIHAVAHSKRGSHLALTLERLELQARAGDPARTVQRIGLSATQNPLAEIGRYLVGPQREVTIVDAGASKELDLRIEVPVESMAQPDAGGASPSTPDEERDPLEPLAGGESTRGSIWPAIYPELLRLVKEHNSTIVFVNNRRSAERVALRLNELAAREAGTAQAQGGERDQKDKQIYEAASGGRATRTQLDVQGCIGEPQAALRNVGGQEQPAPREIARAHHGSLAREERTKVEELLKAGELPCLVATSSLELGIDMGAVDLVLQIESPKSVARGLQRIGRAGHGVDRVSRGRIFPKFRGDLLECAVVVRRMREGKIEPTVVPKNALDVLAQQIVAIAVSAQPAGAGSLKIKKADGETERESDAGDVSVDALHALVRSTHSYAELSRELLENVLDMLDGRWAGGLSSEFGELRARIVWDRVAGTIRARRGARQLVLANAGTIPDRGLYAVTLPDGRRVGELDEEMVYEARPGQAFLLGASTWRIEEIGRDRVIVTPAPGAPGAVPFWRGDAVGRPRELGAAIGAFARWAVEQQPQTLERDYDLDARAARNLLDYLREQQAATRVLPSERTIVVERFRDEIGDWRLCILSPYGGRVHAAWALALSARVRERLQLECDAIWSDDGIVLRLPDLDVEEARGAPPPGEPDAGRLPSAAELVLLEPEEVERAVTAELGDSALFGARFRENAARALLIPRAYPGRRTPLWQQRLKAQSLLEVARRYADFPIVLETYRECLRDVLDVPGLEGLLRGLHSREIALVEVETPVASPFASALLFAYVATYMYEGDTPTAERRAAALSLDRDLLRELLGSEELRELIDPGALARVEDDLQHRSQLTRATSRDGLHDVLRRVGDLSADEVSARVFDGIDHKHMLRELEGERRAIRLRVGGEERHVAAEEAGLYRDALGAVPPAGLPEAFLGNVPDALRMLVARFARTHGPFTTEEVNGRYRVDVGTVLRELERTGEVIVRGELRPNPVKPRSAGGTPADAETRTSRARTSGDDGREWCDVEVLRRLRRASLAALRKEIEPADARALAAFLPSWQGIDRDTGSHPPGAGIDRLREVLVPLQGLALPAEIWERDVLPRRVGAYSPAWLDSLCASGELVWVGAGSIGRWTTSGRSGRVALYFREDAPLLGPPSAPRSGGATASPPGAPEHELLRERLARGPCFFSDLLAELELAAETLREALWDLVWAGAVTNDAFAPLRAPHLTLARGGRAPGGQSAFAGRAARAGTYSGRPMAGRSRFGTRRGGVQAQAQVQGRWSLTASLFDEPTDRRPAAPTSLSQRGSSGSLAPSRSSSRGSSSVPSRSSSPGSSSPGSSSRGSSSAPLPSPERRRALAELLLERYGIVTREQVLAEGIRGGFALLYDSFAKLETLGVCRRGYFIEGMGGAQFALPGAVERLRATRAGSAAGASERAGRTLVIAAADPAQPYGAALPWPKRAGQDRRPARVAGAYVVMVADLPVLYVERGGRGLVTLAPGDEAALPGAPGAGPTAAAGEASLREALHGLAEAVRAGRLGKLALERIDGAPAIASGLAQALIELGFHPGPRRLTLSA